MLRIPLKCSISRLRTVRSNDTDQPFPPLSRIKDLSMIDTRLPENFQSTTMPWSRFPISRHGHKLSIVSIDPRIAMGTCGMSIANVALSRREPISVSLWTMSSSAIDAVVTFVIALSTAVSVAGASSIAVACDIGAPVLCKAAI